MINIFVALIAYLVDRAFGEFKFFKHPVIIMGELISIFEKKYYKDSVFRGSLLVMLMLLISVIVSILISMLVSELYTVLNIIVSSFIASIFIAHKMLYDTVEDILTTDNKREAVSELVSRDTERMTESDVYKASIETYAENLSDGVIAPLFYLLLFGLPGIIIYKTINTMDSMVGYKNEKYEKYGKVAAKLDDIANFIPARITATLIMILSFKYHYKEWFSFYEDGKKHESPNAGHPIAAMAKVLKIKLGGDAYYFGKLKKKPDFGEGNEVLSSLDVRNTLEYRDKFDLAIIFILINFLSITLFILF